MIGTVVLHDRHGRGRVVSDGPGGLRVFFFERGVTLAVSRLGVIREDGAERAPRLQVPERPPHWQARRTIESLKLGVVPEEEVRRFTFGRDREVAALERWLAAEMPGGAAISGDYGSGKTHLLELLATLARERGWVTARASLDPQDAAPHNPFRVYRQLVSSWQTPGGEGFRTTLSRIAPRLAGHPFFHPLRERLARGPAPEGIWEWISGQRPGRSSYGPAMHDHTTASNIYCNLLSTLARGIAADGGKGLLVILDEAENATTGFLHGYQRERGPLFLEGLVRCAGNDPDLRNEPVGRRRGDEIGPYRGKKTGLLYSGHNPMPYLPATPSHLKVCVAVTREPRVRSLLSRWPIEQIEIAPLSEPILRQAFERLADLYLAAYPSYKPWNFEREEMFRKVVARCRLLLTTRHFLKGAVEALDMNRFRIPHA